MRKASVRDLHIHTSELVREAAEGGVIVIERRGQPVAELRPISQSQGISQEKKAEIFSAMEKIWARMPTASDSDSFVDRYIEEDRNR